MHNSDVNLENPRSAKPFRPSGQPAGVHLTGTDAGRREALKVLGMEIAQTALQSIGMSTKDPWGPPIRLPEYALAVSLIFTKATSQTIILNTPPEQVRGTSILWSSLAHDKRFEQIPMSEAAPGDIIIGPGWQQGADGYAGIIVNHGRIVSNSSQGVQDNSSLSEIQRSHRAMVAFRYVGFWNYYRGKSLANAGFNADEPRLPAGQPGGGQWTSGGAEGMQMAPSTTSLSGGNNWTPGQSKPNSEVGKGQSTDSPRAGGPLTDAQRKLLEQKNAEAVAIIARLGDKGESPDTPESILNGPLNSAWGSNLGWMPGTTKWDLRQQYKGYSDQDIALMEAARRNGVRAAVLLAQAGLLPKSQVTALQLRGMGVLADATLNLGLVLAPYDSIATLGSRALVGTAEGTVGAESAELASRSGEISDKPISTASSPDYDAVKWVREPSTMYEEAPAAYQDGASASQYGMAPQLSAVDSGGTVTAKFDGVDASTGEMVDRKTNIANSEKFARGALRQSVVAAKNGFGVRWEVPNTTVQTQAQRILSTNGIKNIRVVVAPRK